MVSGGSTGTSIDTNGVLTVATNETATTLTVTATSVFDATKKDSAAVTVTNVPVTQLEVTVEDQGKNPVLDAEVKITDGSGNSITLVYDSTSGAYTATGVPKGKYTLVVKAGDKEITTFIDVYNGMTMPTITLPSGKANTVVEIKPNTPPTFADMNNLFTKPATTEDNKGITAGDQIVIDSGGTVELKLVVELKTETETSGDSARIKAEGDRKSVV